jgi:hypothetical protein
MVQRAGGKLELPEAFVHNPLPLPTFKHSGKYPMIIEYSTCQKSESARSGDVRDSQKKNKAGGSVWRVCLPVFRHWVWRLS